MKLYADRFVPLDDRAPSRALDLATGRLVFLRRRPAGDLREQAAWQERCARLAGLWHPHLATLVDYGLAGPDERFEALPLTRPAALRQDVAFAVRSVLWFLGAVGLSAGTAARSRVHSLEGVAVLIPDDWTGHDLASLAPGLEQRWRSGWRSLVGDDRSTAAARERSPVAGIVLQPRRVERGVLELLDQAGAGRAGHVVITGCAGSGLETIARTLARGARRRGFVPLCPPAVAVLRGRGLTASFIGERCQFILGDGRAASDGRDRAAEAILLEAATRGGVAAFLLTIARAAPGAVSTPIDPLSEQTLVEMINFYPPGRIPRSRIRRTARAAMGRPGSLVSAIGAAPAFGNYAAALPSRVAETQPAYAEARAPITGGSADGDRWRARAVKGAALAASGRHAQAERLLREAMAGLRRHGDAARAASCAAALGGLLLERGRPRDARAIFEWLVEAGDLAARREAAVALGVCCIEEGRLKEAETALRAACAVAVEADCGDERARLALARCLFWQGRLDEAAEWIAPAVEARRAAALRRLSGIELARHETGAAGRFAAAAVEQSHAESDDREHARAHAAAIRVLADAGDREAVRRHGAEGLEAARRARAPLAALDVRLALVSAAAIAGRDGARSVRSLDRLRRDRLPALWRARVDAARALADDDPVRRTAARAAVAAFVRASGARALQPAPALAPRALARTVTDLLTLCHQADDDELALGRACAALRERLRATGVAIFGGLPGEERLAVAGNFERGAEIVERVLSSGLSIAPVRGALGIEAAAPVRYAGVSLGALACRWGLDADVESRALGSLLEPSAAALAPAVRAWLDRRSAAVLPATGTGHDEQMIVAASQQMIELRRAIHRAASAPYPILIEGESGVGKELVAQAVHRGGPRRGRRFVAVNCAALPDDLIEAELFGYARGAFTGASGDRAGLFEEADAGTLFLDEVSELAPRAQAKLLRALQDGELRRVGENAPRRVDVRVVAASNRPLDAEAAAGRFRSDLLFRLAVIRLRVAPLRERPADIHALACQFWRAATERTKCRATLDPEALAALARYDWPGNVRELQNVVSALAVYAPRRGRVGVSALPPAIAAAASARPSASLEEARRSFERQFVSVALARAGGQHVRAASALGVSRQGLAKLIKRLGLD